MNLRIKKYLDQTNVWPKQGQHILAQYDIDSIVVYQAYKKSIGHFATENQFFGGDFSYNRMTWIKPNFLWMMYRSGWGAKQGQEVTLAIRLKRTIFDKYLSIAVASSFAQSSIDSHQKWKASIASSEVRLQWDPDHHPTGFKEIRKAIQLGIRGSQLDAFKGEGIIEIEDISEFVSEQRKNVNTRQLDKLIIPEESIYVPEGSESIRNIGLDII